MPIPTVSYYTLKYNKLEVRYFVVNKKCTIGIIYENKSKTFKIKTNCLAKELKKKLSQMCILESADFTYQGYLVERKS